MMNSINTGAMDSYKANRMSVAESALKSRDAEQLKGACKDFEALFIKQMLNSMKKTINKTSLTERGMAEDIFEDMLYDKYAESMAETANLGISEMMYNKLKPYGMN